MQVYPQGRAPDLPNSIPEQLANALAEALLVRWATQNLSITVAHTELCSEQDDQDNGVSSLHVFDVSKYGSWNEMPFLIRIDVQPFCCHPRLIDLADVQVVHSQQSNQGCALSQPALSS